MHPIHSCPFTLLGRKVMLLHKVAEVGTALQDHQDQLLTWHCQAHC